MKKAILVLAMLVAGIPTLASAAGYYSPGFVSAGSNYMYGTYNVRYNTTAAAPLISALTIALIQPWGFTDTTVAAITSLATCLRAYVPTCLRAYEQRHALRSNRNQKWRRLWEWHLPVYS